ncbi:hypothetical protein KCV00_g355, partial [Aureobasidium melanogenum]
MLGCGSSSAEAAVARSRRTGLEEDLGCSCFHSHRHIHQCDQGAQNAVALLTTVTLLLAISLLGTAVAALRLVVVVSSVAALVVATLLATATTLALVGELVDQVAETGPTSPITTWNTNVVQFERTDWFVNMAQSPFLFLWLRTSIYNDAQPSDRTLIEQASLSAAAAAMVFPRSRTPGSSYPGQAPPVA